MLSRFSAPRVILQHDVRVSKPLQDAARQTLCLQLQKNGWKSLGIEFLFVDLDEMRPGPDMKKRLLDWRDFMHNHFEQTCFSVHAPWRPDSDNLVFPRSPLIKWLNDFQSLELDWIDCINIHPGHPRNAEFDRSFPTAAHRKKALENLVEGIRSLGRPNEIVVETLYPSRDQQDYVAFLGCLPSHFRHIARETPAGWTLDTAHVGIMIDACEHMLGTKKLFKGFFDEDWPEIRDIAARGFEAFLGVPKLRHLHLANWNPVPTGAWDGFELDAGQISIETFFTILEKASQQSLHPIGANLEINEEDYAKPVAITRSLKLLQTISSR